MKNQGCRQTTNAKNWSGKVSAAVGALLVGLTALLLGSPALANSYWLEGIGSEPCSAFTGDSDENGAAYKEDEQWVTGFISGYNHALAGLGGESMVGKDTDIEATMKLVYNYCSQYPTDLLADAAAGVVDQFKKNGK